MAQPTAFFSSLTDSRFPFKGCETMISNVTLPIWKCTHLWHIGVVHVHRSAVSSTSWPFLKDCMTAMNRWRCHRRRMLFNPETMIKEILFCRKTFASARQEWLITTAMLRCVLGPGGGIAAKDPF